MNYKNVSNNIYPEKFLKNRNMKVLKDLAMSESGFVFNPTSGESFSVNETGMIILNELKKGSDESAIKSKITEQFDVSEMEAEKDFADFTNMMRFYNLMTE